MSLNPKPEDLDRDAVLYMAKLCEMAERYEDMALYMKRSKPCPFRSNPRA